MLRENYILFAEQRIFLTLLISGATVIWAPRPDVVEVARKQARQKTAFPAHFGIESTRLDLLSTRKEKETLLYGKTPLSETLKHPEQAASPAPGKVFSSPVLRENCVLFAGQRIFITLLICGATVI